MIRPAIAAFLLCASPALADDVYHMDGARTNCRFGPGGEGIVSVGPGTLSLTETHYERVSERKPLADGWYRATWACMSEGTECGRSVIDLRITPRRIDVRLDGTTLSAQRCPG